MARVIPTEVLSHWNKRVEGLQQSSKEFYDEIEKNLEAHRLKDVKVERITLGEGGIFASSRDYLQMRRSEHVFHVCAAPYGNGFFVSSWRGEVESGFWSWLASIRYIGTLVKVIRSFVKPMTYYRIDTMQMFHSVVHGSVTDALDAVLHARGLRALTEADRKPVMRDFLSRA